MPETPNDPRPKKPNAITNVLLIARREYLERVRAKSFAIMTVLIPVLMGGAIFAVAYMNRDLGSAKHIAVITSIPQFGNDLRTEMEDSHTHKRPQVDVHSPSEHGVRDTLEAQMKSKQDKLDGYLIVTSSNSVAERPQFEWVPRVQSDIVSRSRVADAVRGALTREKLAGSGMTSGQVDSLLEPVDIDPYNRSHRANAAVKSAYGMYFLMYFIILFYGMNVARSIIEEKTSRVFEVMLATIKPGEMLAGKVIGVGAVGLSQVFIWIVVAIGAIKYQLVGQDVAILPNAMQSTFFVLFFLLGYLLYSSIAAALGAMTNSEQELQQMQIFLMLPLIFSSMIIFNVITNPDGIVAKTFSLVPFTAPLIMYTRLIVGHPEPAVIAASLAGLVVTIAIVLWIASRIYRVGILMYGKKPNLPEILRWLKYS